MFIIHTIRHASMRELKADEAHQLIQAEIWLIDNWHLEIQGCGIIHRVPGPKCDGSSVPNAHYFKMLVAPDGSGPVAETLLKDRSKEKEAARIARAATFFD